jgi:hypothetical protein
MLHIELAKIIDSERRREIEARARQRRHLSDRRRATIREPAPGLEGPAPVPAERRGRGAWDTRLSSRSGRAPAPWTVMPRG